MTEPTTQAGETESLMTEAPRVAAPARRFEFAHKVFSVAGGLFQIDAQTDEPVYSVDLGDVRANLTFVALRSAFGLAADDPDSRLLDEVGRGLAFVRRIRPGDTVPSELLDGTASWSVSDQHRAIARGRITVGLMAWMSGKSSSQPMSMLELAKVAEDPETKARIQDAFTRLADELGLPPDRRGEVIGQIDKLVDELTYIEALRERVARARRVVEVLKRLRAVYKRERGVHDEIDRTIALAEPPVARLEGQIAEVDGQTGETANALRTLPRQIAFIRETRDKLHAALMKWDDILTAWHGVTAERSGTVQRLVRDTYRFVARYFPAESEWIR